MFKQRNKNIGREKPPHHDLRGGFIE